MGVGWLLASNNGMTEGLRRSLLPHTELFIVYVCTRLSQLQWHEQCCCSHALSHISCLKYTHTYTVFQTHSHIHICTLYEIFESFWQLDKWKALQVFFPWHSSHFWTTPSHIPKNNIDMKRFMLFFAGVVLVAFCWLQQFPQLREFEVLHASEGGTRKNKIDFLL